MTGESIKPQGVAWCSEQRFNEFLAANPGLDGKFDLQWWAHKTYWINARAGHRAAIMAVLDDLRRRHPQPFDPPLRATN